MFSGQVLPQLDDIKLLLKSVVQVDVVGDLLYCFTFLMLADFNL
jgi:hypothetical protein